MTFWRRAPVAEPLQHAPKRSPAVFLLLLCAGAVFFGDVAYATTVAGRTKGAFAVSPTGAATYTIPIWAPAGPHGMQPNIALVYSSQVGGGIPGAGPTKQSPGKSQPCGIAGKPGFCLPVFLLPGQSASSGSGGSYGVGWSLAGLSSIYRCNLTIAQDGAAAPIALATSDGYCMDGQRLRLTGGTYGTASSTYQTEIANFVNVEAYGAAGNGPQYWEAVDKNGWEYTYGGGGTTSNAEVLASGSTTAISWQLSTVTDPYGNSMSVTYSTSNATGAVVPSAISWVPASSGSASYNYTMTFAYGTTGSVHGYVGGTAFNNTNILSSIAIAYQGTAVKTYYLTYSNTGTATSRYLLTQVQECAGTGTSNCLLPTTMTYQAGAAGVGSATTLGGIAGNGWFSAAYDFNGDGRNDLVMTTSSGAVLVAFGGASGYGTPVATGLSTANGLMIGDIDGSGLDSLVTDVSGIWYAYKWNGSSFVGTSTGVSVAATPGAGLADVNGDGRADLFYTGSNGDVFVQLNTSTGGTLSFSSTALDAGVAFNEGVISSTVSSRALHFWGSAQEDLIGVQKVCTAYLKGNPNDCITWAYYYNAVHYTGSTFDWAPIYNTTSGASPVIDFADYNDDGCTDVLTSTQLLLSTCDGFAPTPVALPSGVTAVGGMDWNGDGRRDVIVAQSSGYLGIVLSTGTGLSSSVINTSYPTSDSYFAASNLTGDGQDGLVTWNGTSLTYSLHNSSGLPPDLLTAVEDGYGNSASPAYVSIAQSDYVLYSNGVYPDADYIGPMYVVSTTTFSDPSSTSSPQGTYTQSMGYYGALMNLQGRGFDGFYAVTTYDSRNQMEDYSYFERVFPYTGMKSYENFTGGTLTFSPTATSNTLASLVTLSSTQYQERYFAYFSNSTTQQYEVGGTENGDLITTTSTSYALDNYGNPTSVVQTVTDNDPNSPYTGQFWKTTVTNTPDESTSPYCLSLVSQTQTAYTATNGAAVTITKTLTPDLTHCDYTKIVTQSNSGSAYAVTEALGYDAFGNVNSDTVTGAGMSARVTSANWGTTGQFPASVTDPSGAVTQHSYNTYGLKSGTTDPNNLTTSWLYDAFERKTRETRPDGTYTTWTYNPCTADGACTFGSETLAVTHQVYGTNGSVISSGTNNYDQIGRRWLSNQVLLSGSFSRNELRYDNLGRVVSVAFPCLWSGGGTACTYWTTNTYDVLNRLTQTQRPISSTNSTLQTTTIAYAGRTTTVTDPLSNAKTTVSDVNGWLRQTKDPYAYTVTLAYDAVGDKTAVTDSLSNNLWSGTYAYGISAFLTSMTDMDRGAWTYTPDALGERTAWTDAKDQSFSATYDALSRPLTRTEPDLYTSWTWGSTPSAYNVGKLASVCTGTGTNPTNCTANPGYAESRTYDTDGRLSTRAISIPGQTGTFTYTWAYNATTGLLNTLTYPASYPSTYSLELQYAYSEGIPQSVTDVSDTPNVTVWTANTTNPLGQVTEETLGNGIVTNRSFDAVTGWLGSDESGVGGGTGVKNLAFLYDEVGDVTQRQDNNLGLTENIYYDKDYRFSYSTLGGTQNLSVTYATNGNITSRSDVASGATWTYSTTQKHAVTEAGSSAFLYSYDDNGNALTRQGSSIGWTSYNYPTAVNAGSGSTAESVAFSYGPDRRRWQQVYTGNSISETTNYIGGLLEQVTSAGVTDYRHYINAGSEPVAIYARTSGGTNTFNYVLSDHQGSASDLTSSTGASVVNESFTPYGLRRNPTTWSGAASNSDLTTAAGITRQAYTFQTQMGLWMGMNHMNGRVQDSMIGRFLSADPYIPDPTNTQSYNRYSYVNNNPLSLIDPTGFDDKSCTGSLTGSGCAGNPNYLTGFAAAFAMSAGGGASFGGGNWVYPADETDITTPDPSADIGFSTNIAASPAYWVNGPLNPGISSGIFATFQSGYPMMLAPQSRPGSSTSGPQGNPKVPQNPCAGAANAPSPQQYAAAGAALQQQMNLLSQLMDGPPWSGAIAAGSWGASNLLGFRRGGPLDAQVLYGGSQSYGNYAFGVFMGSAGWSLPDALNYANTYGALRSAYSADQLAGSAATAYPSIPTANVANITNGYSAQQSGTLCTKSQ